MNLTEKQIDMIKPRCNVCNLECRSITERQKLTLSMNKGKPYIPVKFESGKLDTKLYVCPNKQCRRVYTKDGTLISQYWND